MTCFVDTNVFVYARDEGEPEKSAHALAWLSGLWESRSGRTGIQVLNEYYVTVTRKLDPGIAEGDAWQDVLDLLAWDPVAVDTEVIKLAREVALPYGFSWWDAQIVAAAQLSAVDILITEDLQHGQDLNGVLVVNPFISPPDQYLTA